MRVILDLDEAVLEKLQLKADAEKRNISGLNLLRPQGVSNCSVVWSRTRSKERRLSPKPKYGPANLPCYERQQRRDGRQWRYRSDRISAGLPAGPLEVALRFGAWVGRSDKEKTRVDNARGFWGLSKGRWSGFATREEYQAGHE